jgi:hypothetical protein
LADFSQVDVLEVDVLEVDVLEVDVLEVDVLEVDVLENVSWAHHKSQTLDHVSWGFKVEGTLVKMGTTA